MSRRARHDPTGRLVPYCRQSLGRRGETRETSLSIEAQAAVIADWAQARGFVVAPPVIDHDELGSDPERPGIAALLARTSPGDTVGVHMWDRLARGILLQESIVKRLAARGVEVVSITQNSDPLGRQIYGVMGEEYSRQLGRRLEAVPTPRPYSKGARSCCRPATTGAPPTISGRRSRLFPRSRTRA